MSGIKRLPRNLRIGGTPLHKNWFTGEPPQPDGVRRVNSQAVELETFANFTQLGAAGALGLSVVVSLGACALILFFEGIEQVTLRSFVEIALYIPVLPAMISIFYFASGAHRNRGAYIRIHRGTRKLYFIYPRQKRLHVLDWGQLEALAGYVPIVSASGYASRHPLYLFGVDYSMDPPTEICAACGNLGLFDGDRSAKSLWSYLQVFMERGPEGLPKPAPLPPRGSRWQETQQPYRDWYAGLRRRLTKPYGMFKAPLTIPLWLGWLLINAFPDSVEAFIQHNVPYTQFPKEIDRLCGFDEKRRPVIRVNGERIDS
ncbi:hypothetical protein LP085_26495 [Achromobacter sp. MY14]|uniref:DUF6708 domain-containing protein n=1 Tax=unclassified Achromobacter TaxID=2626865 RepID=UPI001E366EF0|nr:DUF6708 domain-containing protein [Achromobacter sp. MY14]MCD0500426.1 hypothetical protein [Achromobacter sp. MY14]